MDWPMYRRVERQALRMHQMMDELGVNAHKLARLDHGRAYLKARERCLNCHNTGDCFLMIDSVKQPKERPDFCGNIELFDACK